MVGLFQGKQKVRPQAALRPANFKDFSGGWDAVDDDSVMSLKYSVTAQNFMIGSDGSMGLRPGSKFFSSLTSVLTGSTILNMYYHPQDFLIAISDTGQIAKINSSGAATVVWSSAIAAGLPGAPAGWSSGLTQVNIVPFKGYLALHNGIDKPLQIDKDFTVTHPVQYLNDPSSGSNVNVPIGLFGCTVANYHVIAGIPAAPTQITISSSGTLGVFPGDPAPNDAVSIDVGAYTSLSAAEIRGIAGYRNFLLVFFRDSTVIITLGNYKTSGDTSVHVPLYNDTMPKFGLLSQRGIVYLENDIYFVAPHGLASAKRNIFAGIIESKTLSEIIKPPYNKLSRGMTPTQEKNTVFAARDPLGDRVYISMNGSGLAYTFNDELRIKGWASLTGWAWTSACESKQGRVYASLGMKVYQLGNTVFTGEEYYGDRVGDSDFSYVSGATYHLNDRVLDPTTALIWQAQATTTTSHTTLDLEVKANPTLWDAYLGDEISFDWELPWQSFKSEETIKHVRTVKISSVGTALFTLSLYVDNLYKDQDGSVIHDPALQMDFRGGSLQGFGGGGSTGGTQPFGGGRNTSDARVYKFPVRFKSMKMRVTGQSTEKIRFFGFTMMYSRGTVQRP